jgi:hypothetical protein
VGDGDIGTTAATATAAATFLKLFDVFRELTGMVALTIDLFLDEVGLQFGDAGFVLLTEVLELRGQFAGGGWGLRG